MKAYESPDLRFSSLISDAALARHGDNILSDLWSDDEEEEEE